MKEKGRRLYFAEEAPPPSPPPPPVAPTDAKERATTGALCLVAHTLPPGALGPIGEGGGGAMAAAAAAAAGGGAAMMGEGGMLVSPGGLREDGEARAAAAEWEV